MSNNFLIIDDNPADQFLIRDLLESNYADAQICEAFDGEEALSLLKSKCTNPDVIFVDINMPRMNGLEFLEAYEALADKTNSKVVMLSSSQNPTDKEQISQFEYVVGFISKPPHWDDMHGIFQGSTGE